jgi:hypothetical protein
MWTKINEESEERIKKHNRIATQRAKDRNEILRKDYEKE